MPHFVGWVWGVVDFEVCGLVVRSSGGDGSPDGRDVFVVGSCVVDFRSCFLVWCLVAFIFFR